MSDNNDKDVVVNAKDFVEMKVLLGRIDTRLETLNDVKSDIGNVRKDVNQLSNQLTSYDGRIANLEADVKELEANNTWLRRTLIGAIISGVAGLLFALIQF